MLTYIEHRTTGWHGATNRIFESLESMYVSVCTTIYIYIYDIHTRFNQSFVFAFCPPTVRSCLLRALKLVVNMLKPRTARRAWLIYNYNLRNLLLHEIAQGHFDELFSTGGRLCSLVLVWSFRVVVLLATFGLWSGTNFKYIMLCYLCSLPLGLSRGGGVWVLYFLASFRGTAAHVNL